MLSRPTAFLGFRESSCFRIKTRDTGERVKEVQFLKCKRQKTEFEILKIPLAGGRALTKFAATEG